ncbi:MAG: heparinase II/III family protein [Lentisphaeria bacterium]|nr:heparinase II/III family protein [Lentisphaeria bacterium]
MKYSSLIAIVSVCFVNILSGAVPTFDPIMSAVKADAKMTIDGKDTEVCYSKAKRTAAFKSRYGQNVSPASYVRAAYDEKKFYFFYDCLEVSNKKSSKNDSIELFIKGTKEENGDYYQVYATLNDLLIINKKESPVADPEIKKKFEVKFQRKGNGFCCEIAVSRDLFPADSEMFWRVNFNRARSTEDLAQQLSCWSPTGSNFHTPSRFGYMILEEPGAFAKKYFTGEIKKQMRLIRNFAGKYPNAVSAKNIRKMNSLYRDFERSMSTAPSISAGKIFLKKFDNFRNELILQHIQNSFRSAGKDISEEELKNILFASNDSKTIQEKWQENIRKNAVYSPERKGGNFFDSSLPADLFDKIAKGEFNRNLYPVFSDRKAWEKARKSKYAEQIIALADAVPENQVPQLLFSNYRRFITDGDRVGYQTPYYLRRKNVAALALALCLTGDREKYMPRLLDHTIAILEETTWCVPAHTQWIFNEKKMLERPVSDLFGSETGAEMAMLYHILGKELDKYMENLSVRIRRTTLERTLYSIMYHPNSNEMHWWYRAAGSSNWSTWCSYSNMIVAVLLEKDPERTAKFLREFLSVNANFAYYYAEDGYCDEGPVYYSKAGLKLFSSLNLLHKIRPGSMEKLFAVPRVRAIFEYIAHVGIGNNHVVNYGDNGPRPAKDVNVAICGEVLKSDLMKGLNNKDSKFYLGSNANYLNNGLQLLFDLPELQNNQKYVHPMSLFKDRLAILRTNGFSVAVKAGHNGEAHNHNDLGNVTVYFKNQPIIIDAGNGAYSRINFSDKRYTLWYTRGSGHNAPVFGDVEQWAGKHYSAKFIRADLNNVTVDLGKAYPKEAGVKSFTRSVDFSEKKVSISDKFTLTSSKAVSLIFLTPCKVQKLSDNTLLLGNVKMVLNGLELQKLSPRNLGWYWDNLTAIELRSCGKDYKITFEEK